MAESDLDDLLNDLDIPDAGGGGEGEEASTDAGEDTAAVGDAGGESIEVDDDLAAEIGDADADAGGGGGGQDDDLTSSLMEELGVADEEGDAGALDDMSTLADSLSGEDTEDGGGESAAVVPLGLAGLTGVAEDSVNVEFLLELKLHITFEVGRAKMLISDLLTLGQGSVIELHRLVGDELDFLVNGKLVAKGEVVVVNEKFGCRITSIVPPEDRVKYLVGV